MAIVLALSCALAYGVSDFLGGLYSRRWSPWRVAVVAEVGSLTATVVAVPFFGGSPHTADWLWGLAAGGSVGIAIAFLYRGFARGRMSVVAPLSAVGAALVPVAVGLSLGERPSLLALLGVALALPAIVLISRATEDPAAEVTTASGALDGAIGGVGFGLVFVFLGQFGEDAGLAPLALSQAVALVVIVVTATAFRADWRPGEAAIWVSLIVGVLGVMANIFFVFATHYGFLSIVSVIASLYPASTVLLAALILKERIQPSQGVGLGLAAAAVTLVALA